MSNKALAILLIVLWVAAFSADRRWGSPNTKKERDYPQPMYVEYPKLNGEQLMYLARHIARQTESRAGMLGLIEPGKKGLIIVKESQDMKIVDAVIRALRERGADADYIKTPVLLEKYGYPRKYSRDENQDPIREPEKQFTVRMTEYRYGPSSFSPAAWAALPEIANDMNERIKSLHSKNEALKKYLDDHPEYCCAFVEWMGSDFRTRELLQLIGNKYQSSWRFGTIGAVIQDGQTPAELWRAIEQKVLEPIPWMRHVHVTDPEGTDIEWSVNAEEANYWAMGAYGQDYMRVYPQQATHALNLLIGKNVQVVPETKGVIAATRGHFFAIMPHMKYTVEGGRVVKVEGGGLQGRMFTDLIEQHKDKQIPYWPHPGWSYIYHIDLPVNPKDGHRAIEWGFGVESTIPESVDFEVKNNIPLYHDFHMENMFPTYEFTLSSGKKMKYIDKGYLVILADPEIRAIASKYGDPDDLLKPEEAPPIPGINAPGDYWKDYAPNPQAFWLKERELERSGKSPYIVRLLPRKLQEISEPQEAQHPKAEASRISSFFGMN